MVDTSVQTKKDILSVIRRHPDKIKSFGVKKLGLFGSFVRNEQSAGSDIDLRQKTFDNFIQLSFWLEEILSWPVELVTVESISPYLRPYITREVEYVTFAA
jgi:predicted nucleotidyltransferase